MELGYIARIGKKMHPRYTYRNYDEGDVDGLSFEEFVALGPLLNLKSLDVKEMRLLANMLTKEHVRRDGLDSERDKTDQVRKENDTQSSEEN